MTNADKIRGMSDEQLAELVLRASEQDNLFGDELCDDYCPHKDICEYEVGITDWRCREAVLTWLHQEYVGWGGLADIEEAGRCAKR